MDNIVVRVVLFYLFARPTNLQLLINVRNQGGDVILENITANVSEDTVKLQFLRPDGVFVSQLVDFTNEVEAMKVIIPGEEELSQTGHQVLCFLTHAAQADFIAPDAMAKLRQKNPGTVRVAEEDKGWRQTTATGWVGHSAAQALSPAAARHCSAAAQRGSLYLRVTDIARWPLRPGLEQYRLEVTAFPEHALAADTADGVPAVEPCLIDTDPAKECICHLEVCVNWYPCGLKYCKGKPGGLSYRCGIKTCRRCYRYHYYVLRRDSCAST